MITPVDGATAPNASPPMTADRWRAVDAVLKLALACEPAERDAFVAQACGDDEALRREVESLLAVYDRTNADFLERPAADAFATPEATIPLQDRLATALAGRYAIERELAHGGMATVYLARDLKHDRRVAIKVLREELAAAVGAGRFLEEIRLTATLQHPHILPLFDSGSADGQLFYVMPFVDGETLRSRLARERRLPADVAVRIAREMADALEHAHRHGVVHRDVKPENVLLQDDHALVADFGIALALEHAGGDRLTRTGITIGTPQYMAPEQAAGERAIDARADVYALGAVLHEMLTGESPMTALGQAAVPWRNRERPPAALAAPRPVVVPLLDAAVRRALAKRPEERFESAAAFASAITAPVAGGDRQPGSLGDPAPSESLPEHRDPVPAAGSRGRMISARAAAYVAIAMLIVGLAGGWLLARSPLAGRWTSSAPARSNPATRAAAVADAREDNLVLTVVDRAGRPLRAIPASRPWTPRFSPDGHRVAYGAFGDGRSTSDLWVMDLGTGTTRRLTDDDADSNDPQWSADGSSLAYSVSAPGGKDLMVQRVGSGGAARLLATRPGTQFASDWLRDGSALLVTDEAGRNGHDVIVQPANGSAAWPYAATSADETAARISPDGRWVAYTSDESGRAEVYLDAYPTPGRRVMVSLGGGQHPVWRGDGRELYYWNDGALTAVQLGKPAAGALPAVGSRTVLFRTSYQVGPNTMYDVSPDGQQFVIVRNATR
jgi:serine/threonine-protein kinase